MSGAAVLKKEHNLRREHERLRKQAESRGVSYETLLIEDNVRLAYFMANKYQSEVIPYEEAVSISLEALCKAAKSYDYRKGAKFSSYAATCMQREIFYVYRSSKRHSGHLSLNAPVQHDSDTEMQDYLASSGIMEDEESCFEDRVVSRVDLQRSIARLPSVERDLLGMCHFQDMSIGEASKILGYGESTIRRYRRRSYERLRRYMS